MLKLKKKIILRPYLHAIGLAFVGAIIANALDLPLAWMIGPILIVGAGRMVGLRLESLPGGRHLGQSTVGVAVGLQLTTSVLSFLVQEFWLILLTGIVTILLSWPMALLLNRLSGEDKKTCYFAVVPGGLSEMAILGERYGAQVEPIAIAQTIRLGIIVLLVPPFLAYFGSSGDYVYGGESANTITWTFTMLFIAIAGLFAFSLSFLKISNAWILGGIVTGGTIALVGDEPLTLPNSIINIAQFFLGLGLGVMFRRAFIIRGMSFVRASVIVVVTMVTLALLGAALAAIYFEHDFGVLVLGFAPGGVTEMVLTAKELGFEAPLITAIHLTRILLIVVFAAMLYRLTIGRKMKFS